MPKKRARKYYKNEKAVSGIGMKIREVRLEKQMSIEQLANECDVDTSQIGRMELGKVDFNMSHLYLIAEGLKVHPRDLIPL